MRLQYVIKIGLGFLLLLGAVNSFGADPIPATTSLERVPPEWVGRDKHPFLKSPKPPIPDELRNEVARSQGMEPNAIVRLTIDQGKIVATPIGGNTLLANYLAQWVQNHWVANPRLTGTFKLPIVFRLPRISR